MLQIKNLTFTYPHFKTPVIDNVSLSLSPGSVYALLGPNGAGKSTLLYLISGLLTPKSGQVLLDGVDTRKRQASTLADIFLLPEEFMVPSVTLDNYTRIYAPFYPRFSYEDMRRNLEIFGLPYDLHLGRLSMGQKKKVMMSFALATNTPLLMMDEPTNGLDIPSKANFRTFISQQMTDERTVIISTHQVADVSKLLDHVLILNGNRIELDASAITITDRLAFANTIDPETIAKALLARPSLAGTAVVLDNREANIESEIDLEMLFEFVTTNPDMAKSIFSTPVIPPVYEK